MTEGSPLLHHRVAGRVVPVEGRADLFDRNRRLELLDDHCAAGELDTSRDALGHQHGRTRDDDDPGQRNGVPPPPQEVEIGVVKDVHG
jgi:hypothetical protein